MATARNARSKARSQQTRPASRPGVQHQGTDLGHVVVDGPRDVDAYGLIVAGDCLAPAINDGDLVIGSPHCAPEVGGLVVLHFKDGRRPMLKRLVCRPAPLSMSKGNVVGLVMVATSNPPKQFGVPVTELSALHGVRQVIPRHEAEIIPPASEAVS